MRASSLALWILILAALIGSLAISKEAAAQTDSHAALLSIDRQIDSVSSRFLKRGLEQAAEGGAAFVVVEFDTPGGLLDSTRDIVAAILESPIPVVIYVSPSGSHAASAGTFILAAAHIAAMAPATNVGTASPVGAAGVDLPDTIKSKATQDAAAFLRSIADQRGRDAAALEKTVLEAVSYTESEALDLGIIDVIAKDVNDLLAQIDGLVVETATGSVAFSADGVRIEPIEPNSFERVLDVLADPQVTFILLALGGLLLMIEFLAPGMIAPGAVGAILMALAFVGLGNLPANWVGVGLIFLGMVLLYFELAAPGLGVFGLTGAVSFVIGAFLMFADFGTPAIPAPSVKVSLWAIGGVSSLLFASAVGLFLSVRVSKRTEYQPISRQLLGDTGVTTTALNPRGTVQVASELWSAESDDGGPIPTGQKVVVAEIDGITLKVFRADEIEG
ncbi:MAG: nodulation protein NfeD [SAR202 cluster bacterium]|nr:nodulation protein NfeD [SAR202 cluster bacterium]MDP6301458.1 nodulation protein NfeD [SAR202 cluster bacterium]